VRIIKRANQVGLKIAAKEFAAYYGQMEISRVAVMRAEVPISCGLANTVRTKKQPVARELFEKET
jgi:hypothetical protein